MKKVYLLALLFITVLAAHAQRAPVAINDVATVTRPDSVIINVLANDSNFNLPDSACIRSVWGGQPGWATTMGCSKIRFQALDRYFYGVDTFYYSTCNTTPALCDTGMVVVTVRPRGVTDRRTFVQYDTAVYKVLANDSNLIADDTMKLITIWNLNATHSTWAAIRGRDSIVYHPTDSQYFGIDSFFYSSCSIRTPAICDTGKVIVKIVKLPKAVRDSVGLSQPDSLTVDVLANDTAYNVVDSICITGIWGSQVGSATFDCRQIYYHPADFHHTGIDTIYYRSCYTQDPTICDTGILAVNVTLPLPYVDFTYFEGSDCHVTVYNESIIADSVHWSVEFLTLNGNDTTFGNANTISIAAYQDSSFEAEVCLTGYNKSGDSTICYTFWIECLTIGIEELTAESIKIYPNPASGEINIDMSGFEPGNNASVSIYDMVGKQLINRDAENHIAIPVRDLSSGLYFIRLSDTAGSNKTVGKFEVIH